MLPDAHDQPPRCREAAVGVSVAIYGALQFVGPPCGVVLWRYRMLGAAVPEAAIDEHRDAHRGKHHVGTPPDARQCGVVDAVPKSEGVKRAA